ncbi:MAG: sortase B protein-sorting domain-containing protein [Dorea sp.]|nr:sortase B protein-sorting domain-containing protein [Dorea sp.]
MKRRISAAVLSLVMILSIIFQPLGVQAEEAGQQKKVRENGAFSYDVILPAGYETSSVRYPVIYVLPEDGFTTGSLAEKLQETMKTDAGMDMIIVKPEFKADMDIHSVMEQIVAEVDGKYRTIPDHRYRAAAGAGVGGYLAYIVGLTDSGKADEPEAEEKKVEISDDQTGGVAAGTEEQTEEAKPEEQITEEPEGVKAGEPEESEAEEPEGVKAGEPEGAKEAKIEELEETKAEKPEEAKPEGAEETNPEEQEETKAEEREIIKEEETKASEIKSTEGCTVLTAPKLFSTIASVRGNFTGDDNPWYASYGDVYTYLNEIGSKSITQWYTYMDAPVKDAYTNKTGSTNDMGKLFIGWGTGKDAHEFTVRLGSYTDDFAKESAGRILNRMTGKVLSGLAKGEVKLEKSALTADEETVDISYSVNISDLFGTFALGTADMKAYISVIDPDTGEVLDQASEEHKAEKPGQYEGKVVLGNLVNGTSSDVQLSVEIFGTKLVLASSSMIRIQETLIDGDYQKIDLMGDWYFNYTGARKNLDAKALTAQGCKDENWSVVQPGLGNWVNGYGNINGTTVGASPDSPYFNYLITGNGYYVREFEVPEEFDSEDVILSVGYVDDRCEVFLNGERVGATGMDESGNPTGETTWAVYSSFAINPDLLKRGESNTVVVRAWNDLPFGGGGWYSGPVALYSQSAFEKEEDGQSRFFEEEFESASIGGNEKYLVYLPESYYETERYYPTVYLLHQFNSDHTSYKTDEIDRIIDESVKAGLFDEMIVIVPNSSENSWWTGSWEKMVTEELIPLVDSKYRTIKDARFRMTAGCSMGGQGAFGVGLTNPDQFSGAVSFFGALSMPPTDAEDALKIAQNESTDYLNYYTMYFICGNQDSYGFGSPAIDLDRILTERGIEHEFFIENGEHNSAFYVPYFDDAFAYARSHMYQADDAIDALLSGKVTVDTQKGVKVKAEFEALDGIESYYNVIPVSSYTVNSNPDFSIPLMIEVIQDGKVVFSGTEDSHAINAGDTSETFRYDISKYIDAAREYSIIYKAAVFDRVVELDRVVVNKAEDDKKPDGDKKPGVGTSGDTDKKDTASAKNKNPKTGDNEPIGFYVLLIAGSACTLGIMRKRRKSFS